MRIRFILLWLLIFFIVGSSIGTTRAQTTTLAKTRLTRGANITRWFWLMPETTKAHYQNYMTDADFKMLNDLGVTFVRLVLTPSLFFDAAKPSALNAEMIGYVDSAVKRFNAANIAVILDMHDDDNKPNLETDKHFQEAFITFWKAFAAHYKAFDPSLVMFELLNEPIFYDHPEQWEALQTRLLAAVRDAAPDHTIILTGARWSAADTLVKIKPAADPNVIYTFHFYEPFTFTHQGATWTNTPGQPELRNVSYPNDRDRCQTALNATDGAAHRLLSGYCFGKVWDAAALDTLIAPVAAWAKQNSATVFVGEFGVYCPNAPASDRETWLRDARTAFEKAGFGWSVWGYDECFGLQRKLNDDGRVTIDEGAAKALGLR